MSRLLCLVTSWCLSEYGLRSPTVSVPHGVFKGMVYMHQLSDYVMILFFVWLRHGVFSAWLRHGAFQVMIYLLHL